MRYSDYDKYALHKFVIRYIVESSKNMNNVYIYGFEDLPYSDDIRNYKDTGHYHYTFNSYILNAIAHNKHRLPIENIDTYLAEAERRLHIFDIDSLNREAQHLLHAQGVIK